MRELELDNEHQPRQTNQVHMVKAYSDPSVEFHVCLQVTRHLHNTINLE